MSFALFMLGVVWVDSILVNLTFNVLLSMKLVLILLKKNNNNWELQPQITKTILQKKEKCWRFHTSWLQNFLQRQNNQNNVVLA